MARTGENIYQRKDGRFEGRYIISRDESGKAKYASVYGQSKAEVREKMDAAKREVYGDHSPVKGKTFREMAEAWLESVKGSVASTTYDRYLDALKRDVFPKYANTPMIDVTEAEMNRFLKLSVEALEAGEKRKSGMISSSKESAWNTITEKESVEMLSSEESAEICMTEKESAEKSPQEESFMQNDSSRGNGKRKRVIGKSALQIVKTVMSWR